MSSCLVMRDTLRSGGIVMRDEDLLKGWKRLCADGYEADYDLYKAFADEYASNHKAYDIDDCIDEFESLETY